MTDVGRPTGAMNMKKTMQTVTIIDPLTVARGFSARVAYGRRHRRLSMRAVESRSGVSGGRLSTIETGKHADVLLKTLVMVAEGADLEVSWLLGMDAPEPPFFPRHGDALTTENVSEVFGERLRAERVARGMSATQLAMRAATGATRIGQFERIPSRGCHISTLARLANALDLEPWNLLGLADPT